MYMNNPIQRSDSGQEVTPNPSDIPAGVDPPTGFRASALPDGKETAEILAALPQKTTALEAE